MSFSDNSSDDEKTVDVIYKQHVEDVSSIEIPREEWSSLCLVVEPVNLKRDLCEEGLYQPGSGEICAKYIAVSDSSVFRHAYYNYPAIKDPGIEQALFTPEPMITYADDGQELYLAVCKEMGLHPIRSFYRSLLDSKIDLKYYGIDPKAFRAIGMALSRNKNVKVLDLTDNWINNDGCYHLGEMLLSNSTICKINLSGCRIGPRGGQVLFNFLRYNRALYKLNLAKNELEDEGVEYLARAIIKGADVVNVNLSKNKLTAKAVLSLADAFEIRNKFTHLDLSWNTILSPKAIFLLCNYLSVNEWFKHLNLSWNSLQGFMVGQAIKILLANPKVRRVILNNNNLKGDAIRSMGINLDKAKKLDILDLSYNPLTPKDAMYLLLRMKDSRVKLQKLLLDNVIVDSDFAETRNRILLLRFRQNTVITCGYINARLKPKVQDVRELLLKRADVIGKAPKRHKVDVGLLMLELCKLNSKPMPVKNFGQAMKRLGVHLSEGFVDEMGVAFPGPRIGKGRTVNMDILADYIKRLWPERQLPPTPPPPPPEPPAPPPKGKGNKKKK